VLAADVGDEIDDLLDDAGDDIDLRLARLEALLESMPVLLSSVVLRQNPHNVHEWHKRAKVRGPCYHHNAFIIRACFFGGPPRPCHRV
jgi:hypothetical protein